MEMSRMSKACNYIEKNIQIISGYGFLFHPEWEEEVEEFSKKLENMMEEAEGEQS